MDRIRRCPPLGPLLAALALGLLVASPAASASASAPALAARSAVPVGAASSEPVPDDRLVLESIELTGNERTARQTVLRAFPLAEGASFAPADLLAAIESLRGAGLFSSVDWSTRPGSARGRVVLGLTLVEPGAELRFGTGFRDLDGWYLIPAQLRLDNRFGHGERTRLQARLGYHVAGLELLLEEPAVGGGAWSWGTKVGAYGRTRRYFLDGTEYEHRLSTADAGAWIGRRLGGPWSLQVGARFETVDADSTPEAAADDEFRGIERGDGLPFESLPPAIRDDVGRRDRVVWHAELGVDARSARRVASTPATGVWGRVRVEGILRDGTDVGVATVDLRAYRSVGDVALAWRGRAGVIGAAPWYDRFHLGGLYTLRGVPGQSLSPPEGDGRFWSTSLELRAPLVGRRDEPRVLGLLFVDAADGWSADDFVPEDTAVSIGWGFRVRLPWVEHVGVDFGVPLTDGPVAEAFRAHGALGWNF